MLEKSRKILWHEKKCSRNLKCPRYNHILEISLYIYNQKIIIEKAIMKITIINKKI